MTDLVWPAMGEIFVKKVQDRITARTAAGWPAGFDLAGELEYDCDEDDEEPTLWIYSSRADDDERWYELSATSLDEGIVLCLGWATEDKAPPRDLAEELEGWYLIVKDRLYAPFHMVLKKKDAWPGYYTGLLVDTATMQSDALVEEVTTMLLELIEKVTSLGMK